MKSTFSSLLIVAATLATGCAGHCAYQPSPLLPLADDSAPVLTDTPQPPIILADFSSYSFASGTKDVDLQRADLQDQANEDRAQALASQFSMNLPAARQLVQISDRMQALSGTTAQISDADRQQLADAALNVAGISNVEVTDAYAKLIQGNRGAVGLLVDKAAVNLGMPSSAALRDQLLPLLGIN